MHYAAHGHTAAEVIYERVDAEKPFMGLTSFSGELRALKDMGIAKNYLQENKLKVLNNLVSGYFDLAEINALEYEPDTVGTPFLYSKNSPISCPRLLFPKERIN